MRCVRSYQDIPADPRDEILSSEDYFDMFYSKYCKENGVKDFSAENYELIRKWWFKFEDGTGNDIDHGIECTLEDMKNDLEEASC